MKNFIEQAKCYLSIYFNQLVYNKEVRLDMVYPIDIPNHEEVLNIPDDINILDYLGELYEKTVSKDIRKDLGQFYTHDTFLVDSMLQNVDILEGKILEPSCGSGFFIVYIIDQIISELQTYNKASDEIINYIQENIYGNDNDDTALQITEINILAALLPLIADSVNNNPDFKMKPFKLTQKDFTQKCVFGQEFSLVIGNPPFVTMYGKRSRNMTEDKRSFYNTFDFVQNKSGNNKFNLAMFFVENGLKCLKTDGRLIFIMDIAFFETAYIDLRRYIIKNYFLNSIYKGFQAFDGVASAQMVIDISNNRNKNPKVAFIDYELNTVNKVDQSLWDNDKTKYKIYIPFNSHDKDINDKMLTYPKLDYYFPGKALRTCCALTGKTEEFVVNPETEKKHEVFPYIEGSKGLKEKFGYLSPTRHIKYDYELQLEISDRFKEELTAQGVKNKKRVTLGDKDAYLSPKIFIRQSATEIIATYTNKAYAANNSIYVLTNKKDSPDEIKLLKYVCGILNSDLITYYCRINKIIRCGKGKTPQIKTSDLKEIRICLDNNNSEQLISTVESLLAEPDNKSVLKLLNKIVYKIYNISMEEQDYISNYLNAG